MGGAGKLLMLLSTPFPRPALRLLPLPLRRLHFSTFPPKPFPHSLSTPCNRALRFSSSAIRENLGGFQKTTHPWPEWTLLVETLTANGYFEAQHDGSFTEVVDGEYVRAVGVCMAFARARPELIRLLPRKDVEVIVESGSAGLFTEGGESERRMRAFISGESNVGEVEKAETVDIMRYLLSHVCHPVVISGKNNAIATDSTEASARNLLNELVNVSGNIQQLFTMPTTSQPPLTQEQLSRPPIEMKRGDWICQKCSFMNFARNNRCRECNEDKPQRQLTGGEWECPQCEFFNYGRNMACLRCDCKRPRGGPTTGNGSAYGGNSSFDPGLDQSSSFMSEIETKLAANDEKAERWFGKVSQLDNPSDLDRAATDEDFPDIMPLRKGVNRFVVSTRKTPLERRLANSQYGSNLSNDAAADGPVPRSGNNGSTTESSISQSLDRILGRQSSASASNNQSTNGEANTGAGNRFNSLENRQRPAIQRRDPDYVPFVPLPADMFSKSKKPDNDMHQPPHEEYLSPMTGSQLGNPASTISQSPVERKVENESSDASERWSKTVAELDNVTDLANAIPDEDFPEIMPMRKGENRFVVSKKKDRSLTSPQYKRRLAMEQANSTNFVPFVPFPPDYFAKKDKQPEAASNTTQAATEDSTPVDPVLGVTEKSQETRTTDYNPGNVGSVSQYPKSQIVNSGFPEKRLNEGRVGSSYGGPPTNVLPPSNTFPGRGFNENRVNASYRGPTTNPVQRQNNSWYYNKDSQTSGTTQNSSTYSGSGAPLTSQPAQNDAENWKYSGKSLEGSAVKETDPLDMSEEAKTERWFRRVANIKDISELSQIPDEDFPEIMPMRKGVNRFVVSKRKTPLERRLTSPQYRRNLPIVSSEPEKDNK